MHEQRQRSVHSRLYASAGDSVLKEEETRKKCQCDPASTHLLLGSVHGGSKAVNGQVTEAHVRKHRSDDELSNAGAQCCYQTRTNLQLKYTSAGVDKFVSHTHCLRASNCSECVVKSRRQHSTYYSAVGMLTCLKPLI